MSVVVWLAGGAAILAALDQLLLWAERNGWVYWRKTKGRRGGIGDAFFRVQASVDPRAEQVLEAKQTKKREDRAAGDPPSINS